MDIRSKLGKKVAVTMAFLALPCMFSPETALGAKPLDVSRIYEIDGSFVPLNIPKSAQQLKLENIVSKIAVGAGLGSPTIYWQDGYYNAVTYPYARNSRKNPEIGLTPDMVRMFSDDEMAVLVAHELSHIASEQKEIRQNETRYYFYTPDGEVNNKIFDYLLTMHYERTADKMAIAYADKAGYDPEAYRSLLEKLAVYYSFSDISQTGTALTVGEQAFPSLLFGHQSYAARMMEYHDSLVKYEADKAGYLAKVKQEQVLPVMTQTTNEQLGERMAAALCDSTMKLVEYEKRATPALLKKIDTLTPSQRMVVYNKMRDKQMQHSFKMRQLLANGRPAPYLATVLDKISTEMETIFLERAEYVRNSLARDGISAVKIDLENYPVSYRGRSVMLWGQQNPGQTLVR